MPNRTLGSMDTPGKVSTATSLPPPSESIQYQVCPFQRLIAPPFVESVEGRVALRPGGQLRGDGLEVAGELVGEDLLGHVEPSGGGVTLAVGG